MKKKNYKVTVNFVQLPEEEIRKREDRILSILVRGAVKMHLEGRKA